MSKLTNEEIKRLKDSWMMRALEWMNKWDIQEFPGAPVEKYIDNEMVKDFIKYMED